MRNKKLYIKSGYFSNKLSTDLKNPKDLDVNKYLVEQLTDSNVPFVNDCCLADNTILPTAYNVNTDKVYYYNPTTDLWTELGTLNNNGFGTPVTTTQLTSITTAVTLNGKAGRITTFGTGNINAGATVYFILNNTEITSNSLIMASAIVGAVADTQNIIINLKDQSPGRVGMLVQNVGSAPYTYPLVINFIVIN